MLIQKGQLIAAIPAVDARALARKFYEATMSAGGVAAYLHIPRESAEEILNRFEAEGLVTKGTKPGLHLYGQDRPNDVQAGKVATYVITIAGCALAKARIGTPIPRAKAAQVLENVLVRVESYNNDPENLLWIERVDLYGSFADESRATVGDIDIRIVYSHRYEGGDYRRRLDVQRTILTSRGVHFPSIIDQYSFPEQMMQKHIKNRSPLIDLCYDHIEDQRPLPDGATIVSVYLRNSEARPIQ